MKKYCMFSAALLMALTGCESKLEPVVQQPDGFIGRPLTIRATQGDTGTKTVLQSDGVYWLDGDAINMFYGAKFSGRFATELSAPNKTVEFHGQLDVITGSTNEGMSASDFWAIYPYDVENSCDGTGVTLTIPSVQSGMAGTFAPSMNPTVGKSCNLDIAFYNVGSWLMFSVVQAGITSATFESNGNENVTGSVRVTMDSNGHPVSTIVSGSKSIVITPVEGSFVPGENYYIVLPPQTFSKGFTLTLWKGLLSAKVVVSESISFVRNRPCQIINADNGRVFTAGPVDLGLSVKWANCNLGASSPEVGGEFYSWGEMESKRVYSWPTYKYGNGLDYPNWLVTKYNSEDNKVSLDPEDDVVHMKWGEKWRLPSATEMQELINPDNCDWEVVELNGVSGYKVTSKKAGYTDKWIFFPPGGWADGEWIIDQVTGGYYWTSSLYKGPLVSDTVSKNGAAGVGRFILNTSVEYGYVPRCSGCFIRPVTE